MADSEDDITKNEFATTDSDVQEMFTDAMIEKLEQSEGLADAGDLANLLDGTDDELIFRTNGQNGIENGIRKAVQNGEKEERENDARRSDVREATSLLLQGKRNMIVEDYESAVETLAEACEKFTALFGELGDECGEVYLTYATALIELFRLKEKEKNEEEEEVNEELEEDNSKIDDELENDKNDVKEQNGTNHDVTNGEENETVAEDEVDEDNKGEDEKDEEEKIEENDEEKPENNESEDEEEGEEVDTEDEFDNLEVAWQVLELAKRIFTNLNENHHLATVHTRLGEVSLSSGNYDLAIEDLKRSLEIQNTLIPSVSIRYMAVNHFNLFLAYKNKFNFEEADKELYALKSCCQKRLEELEDKLKSLKKEEHKEFEIKKVTSEIQESKDILKEVNEKFEESRKEKRGLYQEVSDTILKKVELLNRATGQSTSSSSSSCVAESSNVFVSSKTDVPVNNISHLVRKKKKVTFEQIEANENAKSNDVSPKNSASDEKKVEICAKQSAIIEKHENEDDKDSLRKSEVENLVHERDKKVTVQNSTNNASDSISQSTSSSNSGKRKSDEDVGTPTKKLCSEST